MNHHPKPCGRAWLVAIAALAAATGRVSADDTEIFLSQSDIACEVNALFIIDTSGSMDGRVDTQAPWDAGQTYAGTCDTSRLYVSTPGVTPDCSTAISFAKADNFCQASTDRLEASGSYTGSLQAWDSNRERWLAVNRVRDGQPVECRADGDGQGDISGRDTGDGTYAANGDDGPWSSAAANQVGWPSRQVTLSDGNWLNWSNGPATERRAKLDIVKDVTKTVLNSLDNINVGLMQFNRGTLDGGPVIQAVSDVASSRDDLNATIDALVADGQTPLSETLYEAGQYYAGRLVDFGNLDASNRSVAASRLNGSAASQGYRSPIAEPWQQNHIVLLTDGEPTNDTAANAKIPGLPGFAAATGTATCTGTGDGACLADMAAYLKNHDLLASLDLDQNVITHTIGFDVDLPLLKTTAERGGGQYLLANDAASLTSAITNFVQDVRQSAGVFAAPTIPVDKFNLTRNSDAVYISLFEPTNSFHWPGNVKRYQTSAETVDGSVIVSLIDAAGNSAVNPETGAFRDTARDFWSPEIDGNNVELGGAASQLPRPDRRTVLTQASGSLDLEDLPDDLSPEQVGAPDAVERDITIRWAYGEDSRDEDNDGNDTEPRLEMGDPLHVSPVTVLYGGTQNASNTVVYVSTNDGYLHAFNADDGTERWSFIPARLLDRLYELSVDNLTPEKQYGLDGEIRVLVRNDDGEPGISGDERVLLLFGMRRGGAAVFIMDVTNPDRPQLLNVIDGDSQNGAFADLGQTWSPPIITRAKIDDTEHDIALFGGGYDPSQDNGAFSTDTIGNAVYMIDLNAGREGDLLWRAGNRTTSQGTGTLHLNLPDMNYSIPAPLKVIDFTNDGFADRIYAGDMGGQVWRFDIANGNPARELVAAGVIASLGGAAFDADGDNPPATAVRRFYNAPDVVSVNRDGQFFFAVNIGSGYRAHPLDTNSLDFFFSIRDRNPFGILRKEDFARALPPLRISDLVDITARDDAELLPTDDGWRLAMVTGRGEKILSQSTTFGGVTLFTSFTPIVGNSCTPSTGINRLYQVSVLDGSAVTNLDASIDDENLTAEDRSIELDQGGIAPSPQVIFVADPARDADGDIGLESGVDDGSGIMVSYCTGPGQCLPGEEIDWFRTFWVQQENP